MRVRVCVCVCVCERERERERERGLNNIQSISETSWCAATLIFKTQNKLLYLVKIS